MDLNKVTLEDCIDMFEKKNMVVVIEHGQVTGFVAKED